MVEAGKIVWGLSVVNYIFLNFCMMVCVFHVAGKYYVPEEGYGYERLYKVDYGATFQGVTTVLFGYFLAFANFKTFKEPSADNYKYLTAASVVSALLFMQMAIVWGNEVQKMVEVSSHKHDTQGCNWNDHAKVAAAIERGEYKPGMCVPVAQCTYVEGSCIGSDGGQPTMAIDDKLSATLGDGYESFTGFQRFYQPNQSLKPGTEAACTFATFMFLIETAKCVFMYMKKDELAAGDYTMGAGTSEAQQVSGDSYQKL